MKRPIIIKLVSGLLNMLTCLIAVTVILISRDFFGKGDTFAFFFWTVPLAIGLTVSGQTILSFFRAKIFPVRLLFILLIAGLISFGWVYFVYLILGPWIGAFSFPILYLWIIGNAVQLLFLDWRLPKSTEPQKTAKLLFRLLALPLTLILAVIALFLFSSLKERLTRPEKEIYLIPAGFEGKFRVVYGEKGGEQPAYENGRRVMKIPVNGLLIIQPEFQAGWINNEYYLVDKNGNRTKLNELFDAKDRLTKSPGVLLENSGTMGGAMPDGSFSSESPLAIHFTEFTVYNKDTASLDEQQYNLVERKLDSLTTALVDSCRQAEKNKDGR